MTANGGAAFILSADIHPLHTLVIASPCCRKGRPVVSFINPSAFTPSISPTGYFKFFFFVFFFSSFEVFNYKKEEEKIWSCLSFGSSPVLDFSFLIIQRRTSFPVVCFCVLLLRVFCWFIPSKSSRVKLFKEKKNEAHSQAIYDSNVSIAHREAKYFGGNFLTW